MTDRVISFAKTALCDLEALQAGSSGQGTPEVGMRVVTEVLECVEALAEDPGAGRIVPEFAQPFLQERIHPPFRILYHLAPERVRIVRVWPSTAC
jgi:plasmid stabilization system protein ParE